MAADQYVLVQFPISHFCKKVRMIFDFKSVPYKTETVYPLMQRKVVRLSGQRKVPVLLVNGRAIPDSTDIALYLEERAPRPSLFPTDPALRRRVSLWEDWADESLSFIARDIVYGRLLDHPALIANYLPENQRKFVPHVGKMLAARVVATVFTTRFQITQNQMDRAAVRTVPAMSLIAGELEGRKYLVGDSLTLADIAVSASLDPFRQVRLPGDAPLWDPLFAWADGIQAECKATRVRA